MRAWIFVILLSHTCSGALFDWMWSKNKNTESLQVIDGTPMYPVPFESLPDDEKFLQEASKFTELMKSSQLDTCQHKVILKLQTSCSSLTEEEVAKLSVNLLNCQSEVDGRKIFPCTESMSLKECTSSMDASMWNAYHLMSNRARAVCMSARRAQFHALSEMTVNKLMSTAHEQINKMNSLQEGQEKLESMAVDTLTTLDQGHKQLMTQQEKLRVTNQGIQDFVGHNLRELTREKALIAAGHYELSKMTQDVKNKLDAASSDLALQSSERATQHHELMTDIQVIRDQAQQIFDKIDESSRHIISQHKIAAAQFEATLNDLKSINETVNYLLELVNVTKSELDSKLNWIKHLIGGAGNQMDRVYDVVLHMLFLFLGMLSASFLNLPFITRVALVVLVPLNLVVLNSHGPEASLDFPKMTILLLFTALVHFIICKISSFVNPAPVVQSMIQSKKQESDVTDTSTSHSHTHRWKQWGSAISSKVSTAVYGSGKEATPTRDNVTPNHTYSREYSPLQRNDISSSYKTSIKGEQNDSEWLHRRVTRSSTPSSVSNRSTTSSRPTCDALCKNGKHCRNPASPGLEYCYKHSSNH